MKGELEETGEMGAEEKNDSDDELREEKEEGSVCCAQHPFIPMHVVSISNKSNAGFLGHAKGDGSSVPGCHT